MEEKELYTTIGKKIYELRQTSGLTQTELAQKIGVTQGFIGSVEKGDKLSLSRLQQILDTLGYEFKFQEKKTSLMFG
jgi:transcriptional regulator with XRE-family HTH domain